jgi:LPXTG-motif cell wall-anchored protein
MILDKSLRRRRIAAGSLTLGAGLMAFGLLATTAQAASVEPVAYDGNPACPAGLIEFKIDDIVELPDDGIYTAATPKVEVKPDDAVLPAGFLIELGNVTGGANATFDWAARDDLGDFPIDIVLVKAGNGGNQYTYPAPGAVADTGLVSPKPSISHISFCFDIPETSDDGGTDNPSLDDGGTDDPTTTDDVGATTGSVDDGGTGTEVKGRSITRPETEVLGRTTLPATGAKDHSLTLLGGALILAGCVSLVMSREVLARS